MRALKAGFSYLLLVLLALFLIAPFAWMILVSLHPSKSPIPTLDNLIPKSAVLDSADQVVVELGPDGKPVPNVEIKPAWENYGKVLFMPNLPVARFFINTLFVTICVVIGQLFVTSLAAYGFARFRFRGRETAFGLFLASMMFAGPVTQIPVYLIVQKLGWLDTYAALIVPGLSSAFNIFLLRQAFLAIPKELDEAAKIDGASYFRIYWRVLLPLAKPSLATAADRKSVV